MSESAQPAQRPPDAYGQPISDERQRLLQQRLDAWATEASHDLLGPFDSVALTGADVSWLAEQSGRAAIGGASNLLLQGARLQNADLEGADLRGAHLERANLYGAHLREANLNGAHLEGASLEAADLQGADLAGAHVDGVNFNGARLEGTVLAGAELRPRTPLVKSSDSTGCFGLSALGVFAVLSVLAVLGLCVVAPALTLTAGMSGLPALVISVAYGLGALALIGAGRATVSGPTQTPRRASAQEATASGETGDTVEIRRHADPPTTSGQRPAWLLFGAVTGLVVVLLSLGVIVWVLTIPECGGSGADVCGLFLLPVALALLFGLAVNVIVGIFVLVDAGRDRDWTSFALVLCAELLGLVLSLYLLVAGSQLTAYPANAFFGGVVTVVVLLPIPLAPVLQTGLRRWRWARYSTLTVLVSAPLVLVLLVAPLWAAVGGAYAAPIMQVTTDDAPADCAHGVYPPIIVKNEGGSTLHWTARDDFGDIMTIVPNSGALGPGEQQTVIVSGTFTPSADHYGISITFTQHIASDPAEDYGDQVVGWTCAKAP
jgi:hypothetical protein